MALPSEHPGVTIETVWHIEGTYAPDAAETRPAFRAEHLEGIARLYAAGVVVAAGAFPDLSASIVLVRAPDEESALAVCRDDVYMRNGVWVELRARPFGLVVPSSGPGTAGDT
jgi:uncharacterized protein YciI